MEKVEGSLMKVFFNFGITSILCLIFVYAGAVKAVATNSFYHDIRTYQLISDPLAWYLAHFLPWLEIVAGFGLLFRPSRVPACSIILALLLIFLGAIFSTWIRGLTIGCGCFGAFNDSSSYSWITARDILLLACTIYLLKGEMSNNYVLAAEKPSNT